jgi:hypothetical protein
MFLFQTFEEYIIPFVLVWAILVVHHNPSVLVRTSRNMSYPLFFWDIRGVYHNPCFCLRHSRNISYPLILSETIVEYTIILVFVWNIRGLYHNPSRMSQTKTRVMVCSSNVWHKKKGYGMLLECLRQKQRIWYIPRMSDKNKGYGIILECFRQKQGLWYTPRLSQTKSRGMIYSSKTFEEYIITLVFVCDIRGVHHTSCFCLRHSRSIP